MMPAFSRSASWLSIFLLLLKLTTVTLRTTPIQVNLNCVSYTFHNIITRNVCTKGVGSPGTYSAIRLSDLDKLIVVIKQKDQLEGHKQTYTDPSTGGNIDCGVVFWHNLLIVREYISRLNVPLVYRVSDNTTSQYFDFTTRKLETSYVLAALEDLFAAFLVYTSQLSLCSSYLVLGSISFLLCHPTC